MEPMAEAGICIRSTLDDGLYLGKYPTCNRTYDIVTNQRDLSKRMEQLYDICFEMFGNYSPSYMRLRALEEMLFMPFIELRSAPKKLMFLCGSLAIAKLPFTWRGRCTVGYIEAPRILSRGVRDVKEQEPIEAKSENVFLELMKVVLNSSSFCVKGETTVTDFMSTCFIGVPVPGKFLMSESRILIHPDAYTLYNLSKVITLFGSPVKPTKWTNQKKLVTEVKTVFPVYDCVKYKLPEKKMFFIVQRLKK
ncbi:uncharacterized protein LOC113426992 [Notechis scutatus]|uniref:Uncharacterized protein LOC113426992 n=1 Tax=Notechis scutatus TaxID=8663 RepID=A0A6J1VQ85_9SAUR|nr:uncharacterized protein LOC113426992 [Notechis scutatus]